jgi:nitrate/TMAO reductase-like tetraheme cytochrome c subunit
VTPSRFANPISAIGGWIAAVTFVAILFLIAVEATDNEPNAYAGIITFIILPGIMLGGLGMLFFGAWRESRRRAQGLDPAANWIVLDFSSGRTRKMAIIITTAAVVFLGMSVFGSFKAYEYTESNEFCGTVCHTVMSPEHTAYEASPHARVHCVDCHIGPGAEWFVKSKITGAYQLYAVARNIYPKPIHTPIMNLRPARDICEQCHWPSKHVGDKYVRRDYYLSDEDNTHSAMNLLMRVGGGDTDFGPKEGIHWHVSEDHQVEYWASDDRRQEIPWMRVTHHEDGSQVVYIDEDADFDPDAIDPAEIRTMDCIDCHNRPSHQYLNPAEAVNRQMGLGEIDPAIPSIKATSVDLLEGTYETRDEALSTIEAELIAHFETEVPERLANDRDALDGTIAAVQGIFARNYFPEMNTDWKSHPSNIGHMRFPGCMRCHTESHVSDQGDTLARDCNTCHYIMTREGSPNEVESTRLTVGDFQHPEDIGGAWAEMLCSDCHAP